MSKETNLRYEQPHRPSQLFIEYTKKLQVSWNSVIKEQKQKADRSRSRSRLDYNLDIDKSVI